MAGCDVRWLLRVEVQCWQRLYRAHGQSRGYACGASSHGTPQHMQGLRRAGVAPFPLCKGVRPRSAALAHVAAAAEGEVDIAAALAGPGCLPATLVCNTGRSRAVRTARASNRVRRLPAQAPRCIEALDTRCPRRPCTPSVEEATGRGVTSTHLFWVSSVGTWPREGGARSSALLTDPVDMA